MAYGLKYKISFRNRQFSNAISDVYFVNIYQKDYIGIPTALTANENPFILKYQSGDDDPLAPIRASECEINYYNDGTVPLTSFYSEDDEEYRFDFYCQSIENTSINQLLWSGYMVQDSCQEQFLYPPYVVTLKGTDNLGLLKDVPLIQAFNESYKRTLYEQNLSADLNFIDAHTVEITEPISVATEDGTQINVFNYNGIDYSIISAIFDPGTHILTLTVLEEFIALGSMTGQTYTIYTVPNIFGKLTLYDLVTIIIFKTGIQLPLNVYSNIYENSTDDRSVTATATFLEQTVDFIGEFQNEDGSWMDCYTILERIMKAFNCCIAQTLGAWNIIRYPEASLFTDNQITGTQFPADFNIAGATTITLDPNVEIDKDAQIIFLNADQITRINRPYKDVKRTFNYVQPKNLIRNLNLSEKGELLNEYVISDPGQPDDGNIVREYSLPFWIPLNTSEPTKPTSIFLRTVSQLLPGSIDETEIDRYIVILGGDNNFSWLASAPFYMDLNDRINISFSLRTSTSNPGPAFAFFAMILVNGATIKQLSYGETGVPDGLWTDAGVVGLTWGTGQDLTDWTGVSAESLGAPMEGFFQIYLLQFDHHGGETHYKDFNLQYIPYINESSRIIGQYHLQHQTETIKNTYEDEIYFDDAPKHSIAGALFTDEATDGDYLTLTALWHRLQIDEELRLGQITSYERKLLSYKARTVLEGTFYGLRYTKDAAFRFISLLNIIQVGTLPAKNFIFGLLTINYMQATFEATLNELYSEDDAKEFSYTFKYISEKT